MSTSTTKIAGEDMTDHHVERYQAEQAAQSMSEPKRGTDAQILFERELTCSAINGAMAFGYQNTNPPPSDDHWLAPFWKVGRKQAEMESALLASKPAALPFGTLKALWKNGSDNRDLLEGSMAHAFALRIFAAQNAATPAAPAQSGEPVVWRIQMPNGALVAWAETALTRDSYIRDGFLSQPYTAAHQPSPTAQSGEGPVDSITVRNSALEEAAKRVENQFGLGTVADDIRSMKLSSASTEDMKIYQAIADNYIAPQPSPPVEAGLAAQEAGFANFQSALNWIAGHQCDCCESVPSAVVLDDETAEANALEACRAIVKWCDENPPAGEALWCVQLARQAIAAHASQATETTYTSSQATNCAVCGEHKHTPLRIDWMGGYVCLTCIDKELEARDPAVVLDGERAAFEAWWNRDVPESSRSMIPYLIDRDANGKYANPRSEGAWEVWQAARAGWIEQHHRDSGELRRMCSARDDARCTAEYWKSEHNAGNKRIAELESRVASPQAAETQLVGWFMRRSKFGPWIEVKQQEPGAVQFYRAAQPASGGEAC